MFGVQGNRFSYAYIFENGIYETVNKLISRIIVTERAFNAPSDDQPFSVTNLPFWYTVFNTLIIKQNGRLFSFKAPLFQMHFLEWKWLHFYLTFT